MQTIKVSNYREIPINYTGIVVWANESPEEVKYWYVDGKCHRLGGPAIERADGSKEWWVNGKCHRLNGPAWEGADGSKEWWVDGKLHRLDGPAVEGADGSPEGVKEWFVEGVSVSESKYPEAVLLYKCKQVLES